MARQLSAIKAEGAALQGETGALQEKEGTVAAYENQYARVTQLLAVLPGRVDEIDATDDWDAERQIVEAPVSEITVRPRGEGSKKEATISCLYRFSGEAVVTVMATVYTSPIGIGRLLKGHTLPPRPRSVAGRRAGQPFTVSAPSQAPPLVRCAAAPKNRPAPAKRSASAAACRKRVAGAFSGRTRKVTHGELTAVDQPESRHRRACLRE